MSERKQARAIGSCCGSETFLQRMREKGNASRNQRRQNHSATLAFAVRRAGAPFAEYRFTKEWHRLRIMVHFENQQPWMQLINIFEYWTTNSIFYEKTQPAKWRSWALKPIFFYSSQITVVLKVKYWIMDFDCQPVSQTKKWTFNVLSDVSTKGYGIFQGS